MLKSRFTFIYILFVFTCFSSPSLAQKSKENLEKEKNENLQRIQEAEKILQSTEKQKAATVGQLNALNEQIRSRQSLISSIREEITLYNLEIQDTESIIEALESDVENLKAEYAEMLYASYKASRNQDRLTFIFSSGSFNQFLMRLKYFEQYGESRRNQAKVILKVQESLQLEIVEYEQMRTEKATLLNDEVQEQNKLKSLRTRQGSLVSELAKKEKELNRELANRKAAVSEINGLIDRIIAEELAARTAASNAEIIEMSSTFADNRSKLPWPVKEGFISMGFGRQQHPVLKLVEVDNKGVYIQTQPKQEIKAVFDGKVSIVASIPGMNKAVIVQHGDFRTVYANLKNVYVVRNQDIKLNDPIGEIYTDNDGLAELYFELWQKNKTLNPQRWLSKK